MTAILDAEQEAIIAKVEKLLALAKGNSNENEAQAATAKAMELLASYNLDMAVVGKTPKDGKRDDRKLRGGLYGWQRELWAAVAELNFCKYWFIRGLAKGQSYEHRILGRIENVTGTKVMAEYLQDTIERLATEYGKMTFPGQSRFIRELIAYREGMAVRIRDRLWDLRQQRIREDRRKTEEAATRHSHGGNGPNFNALVLADVINTEEDLNNDYIYGWEPGTSARHRAERVARQAAAQAAADKALAAQKEWDAAHPVEAAERRAAEAAAYAKLTAKWAAEDARRAKQPARERKMTSREERMNSNEFYAGMEKGDEVSLDRQIGSNTDNHQARRLS